MGIVETEDLEIETKVPDKSLGTIRTALSKALKATFFFVSLLTITTSIAEFSVTKLVDVVSFTKILLRTL